MSGLGLEKEEEIGVLMHLAVIWEVALGGINIFKVFLNFVLLFPCISGVKGNI